MKFFGYRVGIAGPPSAFKALDRPQVLTPLNADDLLFPYRQVRELTGDEVALSIDELKAKYPYARPAEV